MKKIMFNDKYGLTQAVLEGRKTQTRRVIKSLNDANNINRIEVGFNKNGYICFTPYVGDKPTKDIYPHYGLEDVAVAQCYFDCGTKWARKHIDIASDLIKSKGYNNKMFVRADIMPHRIKITNIRVERLQDISDEDCLKEGIEQCETPTCHKHYCTRDCQDCAKTPREAYAVIIDKVSGKGTWEKNPYVFVYDFELIK